MIPLLSNRSRSALLAAVLVSLTLFATTATAQESFRATHFAVLQGDNEVPPIEDAGQGLAIFRYDADAATLQYRVSVALPSTDTIMAAHLHRGAEGQNGPPVHTITFAPGRWTATGIWTNIEPTDLLALIQGNIYINVHTTRNQNGQVRAQVLPLPNMTAQLETKFEVPAVTGSGTGTAALWLEPANNRVFYSLDWDSLSGPPIGAHFHRGSAGNNGPVAHAITLPSSPGIAGDVNGVWDNLSAQDIEQLRSGRIYLNIHTAANQNGEVRGQVITSEAYTAAINAGNQVPAIGNSDMQGTGLLLVRADGPINVYCVVNGGTGPILQAHVHKGAKGSNGDVVAPLLGFAGAWLLIGDDVSLPAASIELLRQSGMYVNFHTAANQQGEGRGQLIPAATNVPPITSSVRSLESPGSDQLSVWFDASSNAVRFRLAEQFAGASTSIELYTALGQVVARQTATGTEGAISADGLAHGIYFAQVTSNGRPIGFARIVR